MSRGEQSATSEDISLQTRWLLEQAEREQEERRAWHEQSMNRYVDNMDTAKAQARAMITMTWIRLIVETLIVVMMVLIYRRMG
jgi:hypothetical protein